MVLNGGGTENETWVDYFFEKSEMDTNEEIYFSAIIPKGTCTAYPLKVKVFGIDDDGGAGTTTVRVNCYPAEVQGVKVNDPAGGKIPTPRTGANTDLIDANAGQFEDTTITAVTNKPFAVEGPGFDISSYYEEDVVFFRVTPTAGDFIVLGVEISVVKWALGDRSQ